MKKLNSILLIFILIILIIDITLIIYRKSHNKIILINNYVITENQLNKEIQKEKMAYNIDDLAPTTTLYKMIKNKLLNILIEKYNIEISDSLLDYYNNFFANDEYTSERIKNLQKQLNKEDFYYFFLIPEIKSLSIYHAIAYDTILQKERLNIRDSIVEQWDDITKWENLLNKYSDFVVQDADYNEMISIQESKKVNNNNYIFENDDYYYVYKIAPPRINIIRIKKIDYLTGLNILLKDINIVFYKDELYRGIDKISQGTMWHQIIFKNENNKD